jgi:predicted transcriptional regulator
MGGRTGETFMGGRKPTVSDSEILAIFADSEDPVLSAPEVAENVSIGSQGTYQRLKELHDRGLLATKKVGQGRAWWLTPEGRTFLEETDI